MANTQSASANRAQIWAKELFADVIDGLYFTVNGLMGADDNNIVQIKTDLMKEVGDRINIALTTKLSSTGVSGDSELEGQEESLLPYSDNCLIDQKRNGVRMTGKLDEQKNAYDMRTDAKSKLKIWMQEFIERQIFLKLGGVQNTSLTDAGGVVVGGDALWSNTAPAVPDADMASGLGNRYICSNSGGIDAMTTADKITPTLISQCRTKALLAAPRLRPLRIDGKEYFAMFLHPRQAYDLKQNAQYAQTQRDAAQRGTENPIFTAALGVWDGVILFEHEYVPALINPGASYRNFTAAGSGTTALANVYRALFCGAQAGLFAQAVNPNGWVEKEFDYGNKWGVATGLIGGIDKVAFNSLDYGVIALDTYATTI